MLYIKRSDLVRHAACRAWLALYDEVIKLRGGDTALPLEIDTSSPLAVVALCSPLAGHDMDAAWPWLKWSGFEMECDLRGVDLSGAELPWVDFTGINLTGANLTRANLRRADLTRANLTDADLTGAERTSYDSKLHGWRLRPDNRLERSP